MLRGRLEGANGLFVIEGITERQPLIKITLRLFDRSRDGMMMFAKAAEERSLQPLRAGLNCPGDRWRLSFLSCRQQPWDGENGRHDENENSERIHRFIDKKSSKQLRIASVSDA